MANVGEMANCPVCGKEFLINRPNRKYCSDKCANKASALRYKKSEGYAKICECCGKEYTAKKSNAMYCGNSCRRKAEKLRRSGQIKSCSVKKETSQSTKINTEIDRLEILAEKEDLSYGQYVAKYGL